MRSPEGTIAAAVEACRRQLSGSSPTPGLDARVLASFALEMDASALIAYGENLIDDARRRRLFALAARRKTGEPIAYIIGSKEFCGLRLAVDRRVLVPRPETEDMVTAIAHNFHGRAADIWDLGTGSGAIACALADRLPNARILATDVSRDALEVAAKNVEALGFSDQVELVQGDLFDAVLADHRFDAIAANLPYVGSDDGDALEQSVRNFEPSDALFGGTDGLDVYRRMLAAVPRYLKPGGVLYMECGPRNAAGLAALAHATFGSARVEVGKDLAGLERMVVIRTNVAPA